MRYTHRKKNITFSRWTFNSYVYIYCASFRVIFNVMISALKHMRIQYCCLVVEGVWNQRRHVSGDVNSDCRIYWRFCLCNSVYSSHWVTSTVKNMQISSPACMNSVISGMYNISQRMISDYRIRHYFTEVIRIHNLPVFILMNIFRVSVN